MWKIVVVVQFVSMNVVNTGTNFVAVNPQYFVQIYFTNDKLECRQCLYIVAQIVRIIVHQGSINSFGKMFTGIPNSRTPTAEPLGQFSKCTPYASQNIFCFGQQIDIN